MSSRSMTWFLAVLLILAASCGASSGGQMDAASPDVKDTGDDPREDAPLDVPLDMPLDGPADTPADTAPDAGVDPDVLPDVVVPDAAPGDVPLELVHDLAAFCDPWADWVCGRAATCGCADPKGGPLAAGDCLARARGICTKDLAGVAAAMAQGSVAIAASEVAGCLAWIDQVLPTCLVGAVSMMSYTPCRGVFVWAASGGGACPSGDLPCADGTGCVDGTCGAAGLPDGSTCAGHGECASRVCEPMSGKCIRAKAAGALCASDAECGPVVPCKDGVCTPRGEAGSICALDDDCGMMLACADGVCAIPSGPCVAGGSCGNGGKCLGPVHNACAARKAAGTPCAADAECEVGTWCAELECRALPGEGLACANGVGCAPGLGCTEGPQTCAPLPGDGQTCAMGELGPFLCAEGLACQADTFVCKPPPGLGEPCANPSVCSGEDVTGDGKGGDLACAFGPSGSTCVLKLAEGATCENDACADGLFCSYKAGKCAQIVAAGGACSDGNECGPGGSCVPDDLGVLRCVPLPGEGEACLFECAQGLWCDRGMTDATCVPPVCQMFYQLR